MKEEAHDRGWETTTFEGARREMLRRGMKTTFREKLQWLEEASRVARKFSIEKSGENPGRRGPQPPR